MSVEVFDALTDAAEWQDRLSGLPIEMRDIYYQPGYLALHLLDPVSRALCFVFASNSCVWMYPFVLRSFSNIGGHEFTTPFRDIETAYGYGGPISSCREPRFLSEAHFAFREWCAANNVVAEFVRFHPFLRNEDLIDPHVEVSFDRETRSLKLEGLTSEHIPFNGDTRYMLKRAERTGVQIEIVSPKRCFDRFVQLYLDTMERLSADSYYFFNKRYFLDLCDLVSESGFLLAAVLNGDWLAAGIFLRGHTWLHYHLSASDQSQRIPGVTNLMLWRAALMGQESGLSRLHLGGGRSREKGDSLLRFKTAMSSDSHQFCIGKRVLNPDFYQTIGDVWAEKYPSLVKPYGDRVLCYHYQR